MNNKITQIIAKNKLPRNITKIFGKCENKLCYTQYRFKYELHKCKGCLNFMCSICISYDNKKCVKCTNIIDIISEPCDDTAVIYKCTGICAFCKKLIEFHAHYLGILYTIPINSNINRINNSYFAVCNYIGCILKQ